MFLDPLHCFLKPRELAPPFEVLKMTSSCALIPCKVQGNPVSRILSYTIWTTFLSLAFPRTCLDLLKPYSSFGTYRPYLFVNFWKVVHALFLPARCNFPLPFVGTTGILGCIASHKPSRWRSPAATVPGEIDSHQPTATRTSQGSKVAKAAAFEDRWDLLSAAVVIQEGGYFSFSPGDSSSRHGILGRVLWWRWLRVSSNRLFRLCAYSFSADSWSRNSARFFTSIWG